jgi:hypothetical protein
MIRRMLTSKRMHIDASVTGITSQTIHIDGVGGRRPAMSLPSFARCANQLIRLLKP